MESPHVTFHPKNCVGIFDNGMDVPKPAAANFLPAEFKIAEESDSDETDLVERFKRKHYKVCICVGRMKNVLRQEVNVIDTAHGLDLVHSSFLVLKCGDGFRPTHNLSLKPANNSPVHVMRKVAFFIQMSSQRVHVHLAV